MARIRRSKMQESSPRHGTGSQDLEHLRAAEQLTIQPKLGSLGGGGPSTPTARSPLGHTYELRGKVPEAQIAPGCGNVHE